MMRIRVDIRDESGFTLTEVLVAMGLLTIFMTIFTTVTLMMTNATNKVQRISRAVTQANQAFISLDRTVRYASAISTPAISTGGTWHIEFSTSVNTNGTASQQCTQLRIDNTKRQLQQRTWTVNGASYTTGTLSSWQPLASNIINGTVTNVAPTTDAAGNTAIDYRPFVPVTSNVGASSQYQRVTVTIVAASNDTSTSLTDPDANRAVQTFAAINSVASDTTAACQQVAVDSTS